MRRTIEEYTCDICGCKIESTPFDSFCGKSVKIRDGIFSRLVEMDLCDNCYTKMKEFGTKKGVVDGR